MPHGSSFPLEKIKPLHELAAALTPGCRVLFVSGEDCSGAFRLMAKEQADRIEKDCGGTHYPMSGWLCVTHRGWDKLGIEDFRHRLKHDKLASHVQELRELAALGIAALLAAPDKLARLKTLLTQVGQVLVQAYENQQNEVDEADED